MSFKMKDNVDFNIKFIELIREKACLYDYTRCDYSNKHLQEVAWAQIAKKVNESVADCKERWKNLRGCYTRHLKKYNKVTGPSGKRKKPYYLANQLSFLDNFTKTRDLKDKSRTEGTQSDTDTEDSNESDNNTSMQSPGHSNTDRKSPSHSIPVKKEIIIEHLEEFPPVNQPTKNPKPSSAVNETNGNEMDFSTTIQEVIPTVENQDPDFAFLYSVLPDMHEMSRNQKRRFKMGILKLAGDILEEGPSNTSATKN